MVLKVIHRHVCQTHNFEEVKDWCERIIGKNGWGCSMEFEIIESRFNPIIKPVIVVYNTTDKPLDQIKILIALRWS